MPRAPAPQAAPIERLAHHLPELSAVLEDQRRFRLEQLAELGALEAARGPAPTAADAARREVLGKVAAAARQALADIDIALALIATGDYGRCGGCRADIPVRLLLAIPTSRWCLDCRQRPAHTDGPAGAGSRHRSHARPVFRTPRGHHSRRPHRPRSAPRHPVSSNP
ncbi:TraR/DksA family transcriptional regulator [Saccharothrix coeruleofusca]|uniref:TraR/DksA family transcriptional regulator n=1 Tax=Saccharothrix coeruleofusca TaxID=33919 RepID=A0A918AUQ8_9PSEU|nr:hypothetical protein [Saccharothrix coeruleofusca]GGP79568.1 hypothetical protein GCM10010185_61840 [Saccharothrix coeruleofusca]